MGKTKVVESGRAFILEQRVTPSPLTVREWQHADARAHIEGRRRVG